MRKIFKHQQWHLLTLLFLLAGMRLSVNEIELKGKFLGVTTQVWLLLAVLSPILHQVYVVLCWRLELFHKSISKIFGTGGFRLFKVGFGILLLARLITIIALAVSSSNTFDANKILIYTVAGLLFLPSIYLFYSVKKYFGMDRAFGIDHFRPEDAMYKPFVKQGIFKYTSNGMYVFGFLILWIPGLVFQSKAALLVALFNHLYIWVHFYFTELPDIRVIYEEGKETHLNRKRH